MRFQNNINLIGMDRLFYLTHLIVLLQVWEYESGKRVYTITDAHGPNVEVTACCLDSSGYRLATGGFDGWYELVGISR